MARLLTFASVVGYNGDMSKTREERLIDTPQAQQWLRVNWAKVIKDDDGDFLQWDDSILKHVSNYEITIIQSIVLGEEIPSFVDKSKFRSFDRDGYALEDE